MSVRLTGDEVLRWAIRACNQRLPWQQHRAPRMPRRRSPLSARGTFDTGLSHVWSTGACQGSLAGRCVNNTVRYYCQGTTHDQEGKEIQPPIQPLIQPLQPEFLPAVRSVQRPPTEPPAGRAPFHGPLNECGSPVDVLDLVSRYPPAHRRVNHSLMRIWSITKTMSREQKQYELRLMLEHAGFEELLQTTMQEASCMRSKDLAYSLLAVVKLGVAPRSRAVQTLLRVCQERLNEFDVKSLSVLASCLDGMDSGPNVDALKEGLRLIIASRLPSIQEVMTLQILMRHVGKGAPLDLKKKLERKALSMTEQFSLPNAQYMVSTLAMMRFCSRPLLDVCSKKIAENVHGTPFNRLLNVLMSYKELHYRDVSLFIAISDYMASTIDLWSNKQVILFLSVFEDLGFHPTSLMDVFLQRVIRNPGVLKLKDVLSVLKTFSSLNHDLQDHRTEFLDSITHMLQSYLPKMSPSELLRAVSCLCVLAHFPPTPLEQLLESQTLEELSTTEDMSPWRLRENLRMVDLCLRLDRPPLPPLTAVPPLALGSPDPREKNVNPTLSKTLGSIVGDTETLQEGVLEENHYFIDGVITCPLQVTEGTALSERESVLPEQSRRIAVICAPPSSFCVGTSRPRGNLAVKLRHLKILGYTPVLVAEDELETLPEEESAEVLRAQIFPLQRRNAEQEAE